MFSLLERAHLNKTLRVEDKFVKWFSASGWKWSQFLILAVVSHFSPLSLHVLSVIPRSHSGIPRFLYERFSQSRDKLLTISQQTTHWEYKNLSVSNVSNVFTPSSQSLGPFPVYSVGVQFDLRHWCYEMRDAGDAQWEWNRCPHWIQGRAIDLKRELEMWRCFGTHSSLKFWLSFRRSHLSRLLGPKPLYKIYTH